MRAPLIVGIFACLLLVLAGGSQASAQTQNLTVSNAVSDTTISSIRTNNFQATPVSLNITASFLSKVSENVEPPAKQADPKPKAQIHEVATSESLTTIAAQYDTTWVRLFNKNEQIANPDILAVGDKLTVPLVDEQLPDRPLPQPPIVQVVASKSSSKATTRGRGQTVAEQPTTNSSPTSVAGNTYAPGYCTWYAKNMRPDLPNNLGNANTWVGMAAAQGIATGSTPAVGAIGQKGMHVVYVQKVNDDGTVFVSEMNYAGLFVVSTRTVPAGYFQYIY